ncbi:hypothetical protein [Spiroplasma endosymbiont of Virgichneumon dumeticola]
MFPPQVHAGRSPFLNIIISSWKSLLVFLYHYQIFFYFFPFCVS